MSKRASLVEDLYRYIVHYNSLVLQLDRSKLAYENSQGEDSFTVSRYAIISPIRALKLRKSDPARWNLLWSHMSHHESRRKSKYWYDTFLKLLGLHYLRVPKFQSAVCPPHGLDKDSRAMSER